MIDTGPLVGAFWGRDQWHTWSRETLVSLGADVWTMESAFAEAAHLLKPYPPALLGLLDAIAVGRVRLLPIFPEHARRCAELVTKYPSRMDVGDASLVVVSECFPRARLITVDVTDFTIYRRRDGKAVPIIAPQT